MALTTSHNALKLHNANNYTRDAALASGTGQGSVRPINRQVELSGSYRVLISLLSDPECIFPFSNIFFSGENPVRQLAKLRIRNVREFTCQNCDGVMGNPCTHICHVDCCHLAKNQPHRYKKHCTAPCKISCAGSLVDVHLPYEEKHQDRIFALIMSAMNAQFSRKRCGLWNRCSDKSTRT